MHGLVSKSHRDTVVELLEPLVLKLRICFYTGMNQQAVKDILAFPIYDHRVYNYVNTLKLEKETKKLLKQTIYKLRKNRKKYKESNFSPYDIAKMLKVTPDRVYQIIIQAARLGAPLFRSDGKDYEEAYRSMVRPGKDIREKRNRSRAKSLNKVTKKTRRNGSLEMRLAGLDLQTTDNNPNLASYPKKSTYIGFRLDSNSPFCSDLEDYSTEKPTEIRDPYFRTTVGKNDDCPPLSFKRISYVEMCHIAVRFWLKESEENVVNWIKGQNLPEEIEKCRRKEILWNDSNPFKKAIFRYYSIECPFTDKALTLTENKVDKNGNPIEEKGNEWGKKMLEKYKSLIRKETYIPAYDL